MNCIIINYFCIALCMHMGADSASEDQNLQSSHKLTSSPEVTEVSHLLLSF